MTETQGIQTGLQWLCLSRRRTRSWQWVFIGLSIWGRWIWLIDMWPGSSPGVEEVSMVGVSGECGRAQTCSSDHWQCVQTKVGLQKSIWLESGLSCSMCMTIFVESTKSRVITLCCWNNHAFYLCKEHADTLLFEFPCLSSNPGLAVIISRCSFLLHYALSQTQTITATSSLWTNRSADVICSTVTLMQNRFSKTGYQPCICSSIYLCFHA